MQPGRRRRDGTLVAGIDGLVVLAVLRPQGTLAQDVGRQRRITQNGDCLIEVGAVQAEGELNLPGVPDRGYGGLEGAEQADAALVTEADAIARGKAFGGSSEGPPAAGVEAPVQIEGDERAVAFPCALTLERRTDDARVIEHEDVAGADEVGQIPYQAILEAWFISGGAKIHVR